MRADRLVALVLLLRRRGRLSASELARELEVSTRTVLRDIDALSIAGVPVYAERGRHGGFELLPGFRTELTGLSHQESLALLAAGSRRGVQVFGLGSALASAMLKVFDALPQDARDTAAAAADRLLIDPEVDLFSRRIAPEEVPEPILTAIRQAVLNGRQLRIHYTALDQPAQWRTVDPVGLVAVHDQVYLLATRAGADRTYRLSRMTAAEELDRPAQRPARVDLERLWQQRSSTFLAGRDQVTVRLCLHPEQRETLAKIALSVSDAAGATDQPTDQWPELEATFQDARHAQWALWYLATDARVLAPQWLCTALRDRATALAAYYDG